MDPLHILVIVLAVVAGAALLWSVGKTRRRTEALTTQALVAAAQKALDDAQRLADQRAQSIEADQAALAADRALIATARNRMASNAAPAASAS